MALQGACLCGLVRYEIAGPLQHAHHCHCGRCRKHHGASYVSYAFWPLEGFRYLAGEDRIRRFDSSAGFYRAWCPVCASVLPTALPEHGVADGPLGNLEGDLGVTPSLHMFVAAKAPWYEITDGLPQYPAFPPGLAGEVVEPPAPEPATPGLTRGSCLCGAMAYEYEGLPVRMLNCHCSRCRKSRGAAHSTNMFVPLDRFRFTRGEALLGDYRLPGAKFFGVGFCSDCGSNMPRRSLERGMAVVPAGSLDADPVARPAGHIFVGSKAGWFTITDGLPQFAEMPPA